MRKLIYVIFLLVSMVFLSGCNNAAVTEYREELQSTADEMLTIAADAEDILNMYASVWSHSIQSRGSITVSEMANITGLNESEVREHFVINSIGNIPDDFSTNVQSMVSYYKTTGKLDEIEMTSEDIKKKISELNNPPEGYTDVYNELLDMYIYIEEYTGLALNPTGSLQSFNDNREQLTSDILGKYTRIEVVMPSEE